jgi:hypothetical protein
MPFLLSPSLSIFKVIGPAVEHPLLVLYPGSLLPAVLIKCEVECSQRNTAGGELGSVSDFRA